MAEQKESGYVAYLGSLVFLAIYFVPIICLVDALQTIAGQITRWFKTGVWISRDFWGGIHHWFLTDRPQIDWVIPNRLLQGMLDGPRWSWMLFWSVALFALESIVIVLTLDWAGKGWQRWRDRKARPIVTLSRGAKIGLSVTAAWIFGFPTIIALLAEDGKVWSDMVGVGCVIAFWVWVAVTSLGKRRWASRSTDYSDDRPGS